MMNRLDEVVLLCGVRWLAELRYWLRSKRDGLRSGGSGEVSEQPSRDSRKKRSLNLRDALANQLLMNRHEKFTISR